MRAAVRPRRGAVLIVVLGALLLMALLATTFASLSTLERAVSRNFVDSMRARLLAESGVEDAINRLSLLLDKGSGMDRAMQYWGANVAETGAPDWVTPLADSLNPSFAIEDEAVQDPHDASVAPLLIDLDDGRRLPLSGTMSTGTYAINGDGYRLRVTEANSLIHLNDGIDVGPDGAVTRNLRRILDTLGQVVGVKDAGGRILKDRALRAAPYRSVEELKAVLGPDDYAKLRPFVTAWAWVNPGVACPVPISEACLDPYPVKYGGPYRYGRGFDSDGLPVTKALAFAPEAALPNGTTHAVMALDEIGAPYIQLCARAPVNVNGAPREVLVALVAGLRGVAIVERRRHNPSGNLYDFLTYPFADNTPDKNRGDEYGYLYSTAPFELGTGTGTGGGVTAFSIADEIMACRNAAKSPHMATVDYGSVWFGGPFRTWRQWNAFCDSLVTGGLLVDRRTIFYDYDATSVGGTTASGVIESESGRRFAAQAMADVLKANFNPNLTLNEANPDANLATIVDKTDLICNSTEFCFTPCGLFTIESEGLLLRPSGGPGGDLLQIRKASLVASQLITCTVKLWDCVVQTSQAEFYEGQLGARPGGSVATASNRTVQLGPEPDNGVLPGACTYSGFIELATIGGAWATASEEHARNSLQKTAFSGPARGEVLRGHFTFDHRLDHHAGGSDKAEPMRADLDGAFRNNPDRTEGAFRGPYGPTVGTPGRYRIARAWRGGAEPPAFPVSASSDLRIDGAYVERDSALMYKGGTEVFDKRGTVCFWMKPSYRPEMTGKPRTFFSTDTITATASTSVFQAINGAWFFPSHDRPAFSNPCSKAESKYPTYAGGPWRPASVVCGFSSVLALGANAMGRCSPTLSHGCCDPKATDPNVGGIHGKRPEYLQANEWVHVTYYWSLPEHTTLLLINGKEVPGTAEMSIHPNNTEGQEFFLAPIRFGEPSKPMTINGFNLNGLAGPVFTSAIVGRNWALDGTIDEIHVWKGNQVSKAQDLYALGRYYAPRPGKEAVYTSGALPLVGAVDRFLPPASACTPPGGGSGSPGMTTTATNPQIRVLGAAWTWYPGSVDPKDGSPRVRDGYLNTTLVAQVELQLLVNGTPATGALKNDGGVLVDGVVVSPTDKVAYRLKMRVPDASLDTILMETPIVDDVTIFYTTGVKYLSYVVHGVVR